MSQKEQEKTLFDAVRKEVENEVVEAALEMTWEVLQDESTSLLGTIQTKVHEALCSLHEDHAQAVAGSATPEFSC